MKRFWTLFIGTLAVGLLLTACSPELDFKLESFQAPKAEVSGTAEAPRLLFSSEGGQATVVFHANRQWSAEFVNDRASSWCSLSVTEGKSGDVSMTVRVKANLEYDERSASILFTCDEIQRTLVVTQKQQDALLIDLSRWEMPCEGGSFDLTFRTNVNFTMTVAADAASWISVTKTKGLSEHAAKVVVKANGTLEARQGTIEFKSENLSETVTVYQAGEEPTLILGAHEVKVPASGEGFSLQVTSNLDVSYEIVGGDWLHEVETKTVSTNTYYFAADPNTVRKERTCMIVFKDKKRGISDTVHVTQGIKAILVDPSPLTLPSRAMTLSLLAADEDPGRFKVETSASWIALAGISRQEGGCVIRLEIQENTGAHAREDVVRVYLEGYADPDKLVVTQMPALSLFSYTTTRREVYSPDIEFDGVGFIHWGDGHFDLLPLPTEERLIHRYGDSGPHTIEVEAEWIPMVMVREPENNMHFDFSNMK